MHSDSCEVIVHGGFDWSFLLVHFEIFVDYLLCAEHLAGCWDSNLPGPVLLQGVYCISGGSGGE